MTLTRQHLTVLLNALYSTETTSIPVTHPSDAIGELVRIDLDAPEQTRLDVTMSAKAYAEVRRAVEREHGTSVSKELPSAQSYRNAFVAGGLLQLQNHGEIEAFLERHGEPDLSAGHKPVVAGFDTNLLPWRIADVLGLEPGENATVNGFALATGVRDELDWDDKRGDTRALEDAFGSPFEQVWNQPAGANREGRLGENYYRTLRDHRYADEVVSETGDDAIIAGYDDFQADGRKDVLLFSNDRNFIERARAHRILAQRVAFPDTLPERMTGSWTAIQNTLYVLTVLFGVLELPKVTLFGVWKGKSGQDWHDEELKIDCRSPKLKPLIDRDTRILAGDTS